MLTPSDEQLVKQALKGQRRAWMQLIARYEKGIYQYGVRMTGNPEDAKDLMQDVFMSVFRNLENYAGTGSFKSWLYKIAHYRCIEFYRRKKPNDSLDDVPEVSDEVSVSPELAMLGEKHQVALLHAMQQLPVNQRAVIELKFFGQFTFEQIAQQLNVSPNTIKARLYAGLGKLKGVLEVDYGQ